MSKGKISIGIADDHTIVRKGIAEIINSFGEFEVIYEAENGKMLVDMLQTTGRLPDICILDITMPEMNGYETAAFIRNKWPNMKILALSMLDSEYNIIKMLKSGAQGYVLKHTSPNELQEALMSIYKNSFYHSELVSGSMMHLLQEPQGHTVEFNEREMDFLTYCCSELSYKEIAEKMNISVKTVDYHRNALFQKLNVKTRTGLAVFAMRIGLCK